MQPLWLRCLSLGLDVVLDYGFWSRAERDAARRTVADAGATALLWAVSCPDDIARARVAARNRADHRSLHITPETLELLRGRVDPLGADEPHRTAPAA